MRLSTPYRVYGGQKRFISLKYTRPIRPGGKGRAAADEIPDLYYAAPSRFSRRSGNSQRYQFLFPPGQSFGYNDSAGFFKMAGYGAC